MRYVWPCFLVLLCACSGTLFSFDSNGSGKGSTKSPSKSTSKSSSSTKAKISTTVTSSSSPVSERQLLGKFESGDLIDHLTIRNTSGLSPNFSNCRDFSAPTAVTDANQNVLFAFPSGCVRGAGGTMTVPSGARWVIYSGTKLVNTTIYVKGRLDVLGTYARNVEFVNVRILPDGNEQEVNLRQVNWDGGAFYPDTNNYTQVNSRVKLVNFKNLDQPVYFYKPKKHSFILNSTFLDTKGVVLEATNSGTLDDQIDFNFNEVKFSNISSATIPYALTVIRKEGVKGDNLIIEYNSFPNLNKAALKLELVRILS